LVRPPAAGGGLDRRRFLEGALASLSALALPAAARTSLAPEASAAAWRTGLPDTRAAAAVGRLYLKQYPQEASATWLEQRLFGGELSAQGEHAGHDGPFDRLRQARQQDFRHGDVVVLDGWFFARTEARLLALIFLRPA
jgi:hypothetical protein